MAKKILVFCDGFLPPKVKVAGGKNLYLIQRYLATKGFKMHLVAFIHKHTAGDWQKWKESEEAGGNIRFHVFNIPLRRFYPLHLFLTRFLSFFIIFYLQITKKFDIIHEYSSAPFLINRTSLLGLLTGARTVHTLCTINRRFTGSERLLLKSTDRVICTTTNMKNKLEKRAKRKIDFIPIPVDDTFFAPLINNCKDKFKGKTEKVLLFCGLLDKRKGISCFLKVIPGIMRHNAEAGIIIVTAPGMNTSSIARQNRKEILHLRYKYGERIIFIEEEINMPALFSAVDIHIYSPLTMHGTLGSPSILIEGMALGKTIIASRLAEIADIIKDRRNGLLFNPDDSQDLVRCVNKLLEDQGLRQRLGNQAKVDSQKYRLALNGDKLTDLYTEINMTEN